MTTNAVFWEYLVPIAAAYGVAWLIHRAAGRIASRFVGLSGYVPQNMRVRRERQHTLRDLLSSMVSFLAFLVASIFTLGLFIDTTTLVWTMGLFSAAFGLGARPIISDYLTGMSFIFGDVFDVGEKVEILGIEGTIEKISLNTVTVRATQGEVFSVPNGEVRVVRNFSRGSFSSANVTVKLESADLDQAISVLQKLAEEAPALLPDITEPVQVISATGAIGKQIELTLVTRVQFGTAAAVRLALLSRVRERLTQAGIDLAG